MLEDARGRVPACKGAHEVLSLTPTGPFGSGYEWSLRRPSAASTPLPTPMAECNPTLN